MEPYLRKLQGVSKEVKVNGLPVEAQMDSQALNCNVINKRFVQKHGWKLKPIGKGKLFLGDGTEAKSMADMVFVVINGKETVCYMLDVKDDYDLLLGEQFLSDHGLILDFSNRQYPVCRRLEPEEFKKIEARDLVDESFGVAQKGNSEYQHMIERTLEVDRLSEKEKEIITIVLSNLREAFAEKITEIPGSDII